METVKPFAWDVIARLLRSAAPGETLVDAGCGPGGYTRHFKAAGYRVIPLDSDAERYRAQVPDAVQADLSRAMPLADGSADVVAALNVLQFLEDHYTFIRECRRVLRPGGALVLMTPNTLNLASRLSFVVTGLRTLRSGPPMEKPREESHGHVNFASYYQLRYMLETGGFSIETVTAASYSKTSVALSPLIPAVRHFTRRAMRHGADRALARRIERTVLSRPLLYGRRLILLARAKPV